jgi:hypothetical protein
MVPAELIEKWAANNNSVEGAVLSMIDSFLEKHQQLLSMLQSMHEVHRRLCVLALRHEPSALISYVETLIELAKSTGDTAGAAKLKSAKLCLEFAATDSRHLKRKIAVHGDVWKRIRDELKVRSELSPQERAAKEEEPSSWYHDLYNDSPKDSRTLQGVKKPPELKQFMLLKHQHPPFAESLKDTIELIKVMFNMPLTHLRPAES